MRRPPKALPRNARPPARPGAVERRAGERSARPPSPVEREMLRRQANLAERVGSFIRDQAPGTRKGLVTGALLIAAGAAAWEYAPALDVPTEPIDMAPVAPLSGEVRAGLPSAPGRYGVVSDSVTRDARGVYHFAWLDPAGGPNAEREADVSLLRLARGDSTYLEVPSAGDPILYLPDDVPIGIVAESKPTSGGGGAVGGGGGYVRIGSWFPHEDLDVVRPAYRAPSTTSFAPGSTLTGSRETAAPPAPAARTISVPARLDAVSGQARGTGSGTAATTKAGVSSARVAVSRSGGFGGARAGGGLS